LRCSPKIRQAIKFERKGEHRNRREKEDQAKKLKSELDKAYKKIGKLEVEMDFLSKILENY